MTHIKGLRFGLPLVARAGVLRQLGTFPVEWSRHDGLEVHFVFKGQTAWEVGGGAAPLRLSGGMFAVIPAGVRHRALDDQGSPAVRAGFLLDERFEDKLEGSSFSVADALDLKRIFIEHGMTPFKMPPRLLAVARDFSDCLSLTSLSSEKEKRHLRILTVSLINEASRAFESEPPSIDREHVIGEICRWIEEHCADTVDAAKLVKMSGYCRSQFFSLFFQSTGMTPRDYLVRCRIKRAQRTISREPDRKLLSVAAECGFTSPSVFATVFRRYTGTSPRGFLKKVR